MKPPMHLRGKERKLYGRSNGFLAALFLVAASFGCTEENTAPVASPPLLETGADLVINGLEHLITLEGVKEGLLFDLAEDRTSRSSHELRQEKQLTKAALSLGRRFMFDEAHGLQVARLALSLFDQTEEGEG